MEKTVAAVLVSHRREIAVKVQQVLTEKGCIIKTRLGIHDGVMDKCSEVGLILLELAGTGEENEGLMNELNAIQDVNAKLINLSL